MGVGGEGVEIAGVKWVGTLPQMELFFYTSETEDAGRCRLPGWLCLLVLVCRLIFPEGKCNSHIRVPVTSLLGNVKWPGTILLVLAGAYADPVGIQGYSGKRTLVL